MGIGSEDVSVGLSVCGYFKLALAGCSDEDEERNDTPLGKPIAYGWGTPRKRSARRCD